MTKKTKKLIETVSKMPCGRVLEIGMYGRLRAYRSKKTGRRCFALSGSEIYIPCGELSLETVKNDIAAVARMAGR